MSRLRIRHGWTATESDTRNERRIIGWSIAMAVTFVAATFVIEGDIVTNTAVTVLLTAGVGALGVVLVLAYRRFIDQTDELMRKIQLEALALTVGAGWVSAFVYSLLQNGDLVSPEWATTTLIMVLAITYTIGVAIGRRRYSG